MHLRQTLKIGVAGYSLVFSGLAWAADSNSSLAALKSMSLEDLGEVNVVIAASKYEQKTTEAPSSVSIVTQEEIKLYGYRTLADILASLQGFNVSYDRNNSYLGVRGVSLGDFNSRVLLLIDGHRINNNLTDSAGIGNEFLLDVDLIDRVEVIRGPGSVLYGNNAFFGVINVITRKGGQVNGVEASVEYGEFDTYKLRVTVGKSFTNGISALLTGTYYNSAGSDLLGFNPPPALGINNWVSRNMDGESYGSFFGSVSYEDFALQGGYIRREKVDPTALNFTTFNDSRARTVEDRSYVDLKYAHEFADIVDVTARLYYDRCDIKTGEPLDYTTPLASAYFQDVQVGEWWGAELQLNKKLWQKHMISVGVEYRDDFRQDETIIGSTYNVHDSRQSYGVFAEGDFALRDDLHFNGGVRYDQYGDFDPSVSPRLGLIYNPFEKSTFKALYGTAFRAPNFQEISDSAGQLTTPETIESYELVYEQGFGQHLHSSISGFYNQMNNLIVFENGTYDNFNADSRGMELALEGVWTNGFRSRASYTLQRTENLSEGGGFPDSPEHMIKLNLSVPVVKEKVFASLEFQYVSSRHTVYTDPNTAATVPGVDTPGFPTVNFTLFSKDIVKNLEVSASIYNLLDETYSDPASRFHLESQIPQDGRSFRLKLAYRF